MIEIREIIFEKVYASPRPPPKISLKDNWSKELNSEVAGCSEDSQQTQPKTKNPIVRKGRPVLPEQPSGSSARKIENVSNCESANSRTGRYGGLIYSMLVVYPCLSYSSDDHHLLHSCLGTGARVGTQNRFRLYRASLVHLVSSIAPFASVGV